MGLRQTAEKDLGAIIEDSVRGFGFPIEVIDPAGNKANLTGFSNDISLVIDPDTGQAVSGRAVTIALRMSSITAAGLTLPQGIANEASAPWLVTFDDIGGVSHTFKVSQSNPDRALGVVTCFLELYTA